MTIKPMAPIAIYSTDRGNLLIRQEGLSRQTEDHVVIVPHQHLRLFVEALNREYRALKSEIKRARKAERGKLPRRISQHGVGNALAVE
ncbi:hypothetical protein WK23_19940 [Burkholderia vietnamiensis]|nr:hypothetical protein WK23_19940 [Burkholderia vietnamiensis]